ncbi:MAG: lytic transglycosylase domain-containing protein [Bacteroidota bacterium]
MNKRAKIISYFACGTILGISIMAFFAFKPVDKSPNIDAADYGDSRGDGRSLYKWYPPELPKTLDFAGEKMPLEKWDVRERLEREMMINYYMHGSTLYILKLSTRYFPLIEERLRANGVPDDFKYVCVAESSLQQSSLSPVGAASFWQFMKETAPHYKLEVNNEVDERFNIRKATDAACDYYKEAHSKFGSWTAAAASYNCGMAGYASQCDFQKASNFYDLAFPEETNRYIYRIAALKYIIVNARNLGLVISGNEAYKPIKTKSVIVDASITNLADFAIEHGSNYKMLKLLNPWLRAHTLTVKPGKTYTIEFPIDTPLDTQY